MKTLIAKLRILRRDRGQSAVETALTLPLFTFLFAGILQLTMIQHAQLMLNYAAFQAARSGIVYNGDRVHMEHAACMALVPTLTGAVYGGGVGQRRYGLSLVEGTGGALNLDDTSHKDISLAKFVEAYVFACGANEAGRLAASSGIAKSLGLDLAEFIRVDILNPDPNTAPAWAQDGEIEFDDVGVKDGPDAPFGSPARRGHSATQGFVNSDEQRHSTLLTVRVRYLYPMHVPFANKIIQLAWLLSQFKVDAGGAIDRTYAGKGHTETENSGLLAKYRVLGAIGDVRVPDAPIGGAASPPLMTKNSVYALWALGQGTGAIYLLPMQATYTMRMQSNFYVGGPQ